MVRTRLLAEIEAHQRSKGYPPTRQELAKALGLTSTSTIHHHLWVLAVQGQLRIVEGIARGLVPRELPAVSPSRELLELASSWEANSGSSGVAGFSMLADWRTGAGPPRREAQDASSRRLPGLLLGSAP